VNGLVALLLLGIAAGIALTMVVLLVAPVVRGWREDRPASDDDWALATPGAIATRVIDHLLTIGVAALLLLAFRLGGVL
jgi:hypothetical protein